MFAIILAASLAAPPQYPKPLQYQIDAEPTVAPVVTPDQPAPAGYQWQRREGEPWKLVKEVSQPAASFQPAGGTRPTTAPPAGVRNSSSTVPDPFRAATPTAAGWTAPFGGTSDCPPAG